MADQMDGVGLQVLALRYHSIHIGRSFERTFGQTAMHSPNQPKVHSLSRRLLPVCMSSCAYRQQSITPPSTSSMLELALIIDWAIDEEEMRRVTCNLSEMPM